MALQALIFDVDGTLADTERDGHRSAFNAAFADAGWPGTGTRSATANCCRSPAARSASATSRRRRPRLPGPPRRRRGDRRAARRQDPSATSPAREPRAGPAAARGRSAGRARPAGPGPAARDRDDDEPGERHRAARGHASDRRAGLVRGDRCRRRRAAQEAGTRTSTPGWSTASACGRRSAWPSRTPAVGLHAARRGRPADGGHAERRTPTDRTSPAALAVLPRPRRDHARRPRRAPRRRSTRRRLAPAGPTHRRSRPMDQSAATPTSASTKRSSSPAAGTSCAPTRMKPKAGTGYLEAAAHFAAESSTGTNVEVSTTDDFTKGVDALVYHVDEATEDMRIAYPLDLFDRNVTDGRMMMVSFLTLTIGNNQGMGDIEYAKMVDFCVPPEVIRQFDGPVDEHRGPVAHPRPPGRGRRLHRRARSSSRSSGLRPSRSPRPPTSSGSAATSSRTTSRRATRCSRRSRRPSRWSTTR